MTAALLNFPPLPESRELHAPGEGWHQRRQRFAIDIVLLLYGLSGAAYLVWRLGAFNQAEPIWSAGFYLAEMAGFWLALARFAVLRAATPIAIPGPLPDLPEVDIFVPTYGEPVEIVRRTLYASLRVRGASQVWLLDDANSPQMAALAAELGCKYLPRQHNIGAKAGNLNHGLAHSTAAFVAVFDADHAPEARFLEQVMGWFSDTRMAFVQTPQDYFNTDSYQHGFPRRQSIWHEQSLFHWVEQPGRHNLGAATCCGCSMVFRRRALDEIGGFPEGTVTEDMHASVLVHKCGWRSAFHPEPLAYGIAPASQREFVRQRLRWGEGNMQVCRAEGIPFSRQLSFAQNLSYFLLGTTYLEAWLKLTFYIAPILYLITGLAPIDSPLAPFLLVFLPYLAFTMLAVSETGQGYAPFFRLEQFAMARLAAGLGAAWGAFRRQIPFRVTLKTRSARGVLVFEGPQWALLAGVLVGLTAFTWRFAESGDIFDGGVGIALALLGMFIGVLAVQVIANSRRSLRIPGGIWCISDRMPVRLADNRLAMATALSAERVRFSGDPVAPVPQRLEFAVGARTFSASAVPAPDGSFHLSWDDPGEGDAFDHALLVAPWRRALAGRSERSATVLERLGLLRKPTRGSIGPGGLWGMWASGDAKGMAWLPAEGSEQAVLFGTLPAESDFVEITTEGGPRTALARRAGMPPLSITVQQMLREYGGRSYFLDVLPARRAVSAAPGADHGPVVVGLG